MHGDFLDSNVLVYAFSDDPRFDIARAMLAAKVKLRIFSKTISPADRLPDGNG
jgi:hypothetical protein